jgi:hypothetical protein
VATDWFLATRQGALAERPARLSAMQPVPIDEGAKDRRRIGPFWIEEGLGVVVAGGLFLVVVVALYVLAVVLRPA